MARWIRSEAATLVPKELLDARSEARAHVDSARDAAARLVADAEARARAIEDAARRALAEREVAAAAALQRALVEERARSEGDVLRLALAVAEKLVGRALEVDRELAIGLVRDATARLADAGPVVVRVTPTDAARVRDALPGVRVEPDAALAPGDALVESRIGAIDARLSVRIAELGRYLGGEERT